FEREFPTTPDMTLISLDPAFERIALCRGNRAVEIRSVIDQKLLVTLPASTNRPTFVGIWSSDGRYLAVTRVHGSRLEPKDVEVWEVSSGRGVLLRRNLPCGAISFDPNASRLLAA